MRYFFVEPVESLMFGHPRSFAAGEAHRSTSLFPPSPYAFQGLLRSRLLHAARPPLDFEAPDARNRIEALVGTPDALKASWQITGPYPARRIRLDDGAMMLDPWFPAPRFLLRGEKEEILMARPTSKTHEAQSDLEGALLFGRPEAGSCEPLTGWLSSAGLEAALASGFSNMCGAEVSQNWSPSLPPFVQHDLRPGLALKPGASTAQHGLLYFLEAVRFAPDSGFWGRFSPELPEDFAADALEAGLASFGRKGRLVRFDGVEKISPAWEALLAKRHLPKESDEDDLHWLVTLSPLRLEAPHTLTPRTPLPGGVRLEVRAALTGAPLTLGGFSLARGTARPNRLYVPAGSAWAVQLKGGTPQSRAEALRILHDSHPFGPPEEAAMGFGHILVGLGSRTGGDT